MNKLAKAQQLDDGEHIQIHLVSISELVAIARRDDMTDVGAVLLAYDKLMRLKSDDESENSHES